MDGSSSLPLPRPPPPRRSSSAAPSRRLTTCRTLPLLPRQLRSTSSAPRRPSPSTPLAPRARAAAARPPMPPPPAPTAVVAPPRPPPPTPATAAQPPPPLPPPSPTAAAAPLPTLKAVGRGRQKAKAPVLHNMAIAESFLDACPYLKNLLEILGNVKAGEKRKEEEIIELEGSLGKSNAVKQELVALERELSTHRRTGSIDSFGLYLYGIVLRDKGCEGLARTVLIESVNSYPWNWSAWLELQSLCTSSDILNKLNLKNHWMKHFFLASAHLELKMHEEALKRYERLMGVFCCSDYIQAQIATVQYRLNGYVIWASAR